MALIECPECGNGVSDLAESCPRCAYPLAKDAIPHTNEGEFHTLKPSPAHQSHRLWVVLLILTAVIAAPHAPNFPLWFGIVLLVLCVTSCIPVVQVYSSRLLRLNANKKLRGNFRVIIYFSIGLALIMVSQSGFKNMANRDEYNALQGRIEAKRTAEKNKKRILTRKANSQVVASVKKAEEAWQNGNSFLAEQILELASKTTDVSDMKPIRELRTRMANAKVKTLVEDAKNEINNRYLELAKDKVQTALTLPHADALADANKLNEQIIDATDSNRIRAILMNLSDNDFQKFQEGGDLPKRLVTGYEPLDNNALVMAKSQIVIVTDAREKHRQEELERERIAAEVARKAEEERKVRQLAAAKATKKAEKDRQRRLRDAEVVKRMKEHKERIEKGFSVWDGSHKGLTKLIKKLMNDPDSYDHVETVYSESSDHLVVKTTFRGKNAFGGVVINWVIAKVDFNGNVIQIMSQGP